VKHRRGRQSIAHQPLTDPEPGRRFADEAADRKERLDYLHALNAVVEDYDALRGGVDIAAEMHHAERLRDLVVSLLEFEGIRPPEGA
jgi:hypothetical protein